MTPPKCRICGAREHNHRCQGGTPAQRVAEEHWQRKAQQAAATRNEEIAELMAARKAEDRPPQPVAPTVAHEPPPTALREEREPAADRLRQADAPHPAARRTAWHEDSDAEGERTEIRDYQRKPARFYAPPNQCIYCDRRREAARRSMAAVRERGTDA